MGIHPVGRKWWFSGPVVMLAAFSVFWLFSAAGVSALWIDPWSTSRAILFMTSFFTIQRFFSFVLKLALAWFAPAALDDRKVVS
jgi:hypothetical protein